MKKLVFMFVAVATMSFAVSFSSCGGAQTTADSTNADSPVVENPAAPGDSAANAAAGDSATTAGDSVKA